MHIKERHPEDFELFNKYGTESVRHPDMIIKDEKHTGTIFMIKKLPGTNNGHINKVLYPKSY